jgi:hypothetical protein
MRLTYVTLVVLAAACTQEVTTLRGPSGSGGDGAVPAELSRVDRTADPSCRATWLAGAYGEVIDERGAPLAGVKVQLCLRLAPDGNLLCLSPADSGTDGSFAREIPETSRCVEHVAMRVLLPMTARPTTYCEVDLGAADDGLLGMQEPLVLYSATGPAALPPEGDPATPRAVNFAGGVELTVTPANIVAPARYAELAIGTLAGSDLPCFAQEAGVRRLFGFYPEAEVNGEFAVRVPNADGLAPSTQVDLFVLGGLDTKLANGQVVPEAEFVAYGTGTVSADGATITSDPGSGLPALSWFGYRPR